MLFYKFVFFISDFLELQRKSFFIFFNYQLGQTLAFKEFQPFLSFTNENTRSSPINFISHYYKFLKPSFNIKESIFLAKTYCCNLYVPVLISGTSLQWIFLGTLPLLTRRGHFIINGIPRIVLNQIVRSPGVYFHKEKLSKDRRLFYAEIISKRGSWVRLEIDKKKKVWVCFQQKSGIPRISLSSFFQKYIDQHLFFYLNTLLLIQAFKEQKKYPKALSKHQAKAQSKANSLTPKSVYFYCNLGKIGRFRLNKKLGLSLKTTMVTTIDFLAISNLLFQLTSQDECVFLDDIDDLKNRKLKTIGDLLENELIRGLQRLQKSLKIQLQRDFRKRKQKKTDIAKRSFLRSESRDFCQTKVAVGQNSKASSTHSFFSIFNNQSLNSTFKEFFHSHQLSQYLDQSNPLAEITHKRRLSCLGSGGVNRETAGMEIRGIHSSHYGRLCPIETAEGKNAGLVNSLTTAVFLNKKGFLETPFVEVYKQHLQNHKKTIYFTVKTQETKNIFFNPQLPQFKNISVSLLRKQNFQKCHLNKIQFIAHSSQQFFSIATTCVPFMEHNDANRVLMGSSLQRQALPLLYLEQPLVTTVNSFRVLSDLDSHSTSSQSGFVIYVSRQKLYVLSL